VQSQTLAARIGRWSAQHRRKAILGWLAFVLVAVVAGAGMVGQKTPDQAQSPIADSGTANTILDNAYPDRASETVMVQAPEGQTVRSREVRQTIDDVVATVS
jgi:RND superfamily putative drug exporter